MKNSKTPLQHNYSPELDKSKELNEEDSNHYQSLIGILRWIVEMGRIDICMEVSVMSSYVACPREDHLQELLRIFVYLKCHHNARLVFDPSYPELDENFNDKKDG